MMEPSALLFLIPAFPLAGALLNGLFGRKMSERAVGAVGVLSVVLSAAVTTAFLVTWIRHPQTEAWTQILWTWLDVGGFRPTVSLQLDALSLVMAWVVSFVSFLIHLYSVEFMHGEEGYSRFFGSMNLFVASMLTLVLAENLFLLFLGWEGVGLCSYLLIGFWYRDAANGRAARKAFIVTRIGDAAMTLGLIYLSTKLGTLEIPDVLWQAEQHWKVGSAGAVIAAALLLVGALGKSAQLPLQVWLPDAMAGPTPVSALIHAATMVTAGVYLIARMHSLFLLAPQIQIAVAWIGVVTLLLAGFSALCQTDIKKILAYSTISQIGYMFLGLGVGAWSAAIFHFVTHAFFKALLFLGAGAVILALDDEHNVHKMGGLRKQLPWVFWTFLAGAASLAALPGITAGFYSKDLILLGASTSTRSGASWLWMGGLLGAGLTALYAFRMVFLVFFGAPKREVSRKPGLCMRVPLLILGILSLIGGMWDVPRFLEGLFAPLPARSALLPGLAAGFISVLGVVVAAIYFLKPRRRILVPGILARLWSVGWGFDQAYGVILVRPFYWLARVNRKDWIDSAFDGAAWVSRCLNEALSNTQTGKLRWYAAMIAAGTVIYLGIMEHL
jgi:NADH-quinone oxidoreductase subunit L